MLFEMPENEDEPKKETAGGGKEFDGSQEFPANHKLSSVIDLIEIGKCIHWVSEGDWNMHDLLSEILTITGPANVYLSSYAFSEYPARLIADMKSRGVILELHCLIDKRLDVRSASALTIIKNIATKLELVNTHAKVTVIENDERMIVILGSANYTTNKRYETGVIIDDREAASFHKNWIVNAFTSN